MFVYFLALLSGTTVAMWSITINLGPAFLFSPPPPAGPYNYFEIFGSPALIIIGMSEPQKIAYKKPAHI